MIKLVLAIAAVAIFAFPAIELGNELLESVNATLASLPIK